MKRKKISGLVEIQVPQSLSQEAVQAALPLFEKTIALLLSHEDPADACRGFVETAMWDGFVPERKLSSNVKEMVEVACIAFWWVYAEIEKGNLNVGNDLITPALKEVH